MVSAVGVLLVWMLRRGGYGNDSGLGAGWVGLSALTCLRGKCTWGFARGWYVGAPLALGFGSWDCLGDDKAAAKMGHPA